MLENLSLFNGLGRTMQDDIGLHAICLSGRLKRLKSYFPWHRNSGLIRGLNGMCTEVPEHNNIQTCNSPCLFKSHLSFCKVECADILTHFISAGIEEEERDGAGAKISPTSEPVNPFARSAIQLFRWITSAAGYIDRTDTPCTLRNYQIIVCLEFPFSCRRNSWPRANLAVNFYNRPDLGHHATDTYYYSWSIQPS